MGKQCCDNDGRLQSPNEKGIRSTLRVFATVCFTILVVFFIIKLYMYGKQGRLDSWYHLGKSYRERLEALYDKHNPEKLAENPRHIDTLLRKYQWTMGKLFSKLRRKYNLTEYEL